MTALLALGPLAATPLFVWLLMEFGPERSVIFALYWIVPSIIFAIAMPILRWRGRSLSQASVRAAAWALAITILAFIGLFFGFTPRVGAATLDRVENVTQRADTTVKTSIVIPSEGRRPEARNRNRPERETVIPSNARNHHRPDRGAPLPV